MALAGGSFCRLCLAVRHLKKCRTHRRKHAAALFHKPKPLNSKWLSKPCQPFSHDFSNFSETSVSRCFPPIVSIVSILHWEMASGNEILSYLSTMTMFVCEPYYDERLLVELILCDLSRGKKKRKTRIY